MTGAQGFQVKSTMLQLAVLILLATAILQAQDSDSTPHTTQFVTVEQDVKLEVVDWGGSGRPLVFLAGLGNDAHVFDKFAPKFTANHHVYGITRRGFGASGKRQLCSGPFGRRRVGCYRFAPPHSADPGGAFGCRRGTEFDRQPPPR